MPAHPNAPAATTTTLEKVLQTLHAHPGATSAQIADAAGLGRSTAAKTLASLTSQGQVNRTPGIRAGGTRAPDQWHPVGPADQASAEPTDQTSVEPDQPATEEQAAPAERKKDTKAGRGKSAAKPGPARGAPSRGDEPAEPERGQRLKPGELRGQVEQYLTEHPGQDYTPTALGHLLGRSSGAIANALEKLAADDHAVLATPKPRTYRSAPPE